MENGSGEARPDLVVRDSRPERGPEVQRQISVYDDPIYIADAAVYLKAHNPDLGIEDQRELDENQFNAAVDLLKQRHPFVGDCWSGFRLKRIQPVHRWR